MITGGVSEKAERLHFINSFGKLLKNLYYVLQTVTSWFEEFNDEQKNLLLLQLLVCGQFIIYSNCLIFYIC